MLQEKPRMLRAFIETSLDGYFCDPDGDMSFAHKSPDDVEWYEFVAGNAASGGMLLLGRKTYEIMAAWWPTPAAVQAMPEVAEGMNAMPKMVFSRTMRSAEWRNATLVTGDLVETVRQMKNETGPDITILGSGSILQQLADARLIDELQIVVNPLALGAGRSLFSGVTHSVELMLTRTRVFSNGCVVLWYHPR